MSSELPSLPKPGEVHEQMTLIDEELPYKSFLHDQPVGLEARLIDLFSDPLTEE